MRCVGYRIVSPKNVLDWVSCGQTSWMRADIHQQEIPFWIKDLSTQWMSVAVLGFPWNERVKGIEPSYEAWEAAVLPLNYTRTSRAF